LTEPLCGCGRPCRDATICTTCAYRLDDAIAEICGDQGLGTELDVAFSKQARIVRPAPKRGLLADVDERQYPGTLRPQPLPYDERAADAAEQLHAVLGGWARVIVDETGADLPADTVTAIATWLRPRVGWLRHHPAGQEAHDEITAAVRAARSAVDRPAERIYAGPCDQCSEDLYGRAGGRIVECGGCDAVYEIEARRAWLLQSAEDVLATATEIARALTRLGQPVTAAQIRGYAHRGRIVSHGKDRLGHPRYRLGAVIDVLAGIDRQAGPVCRRRRCGHGSCETIREHLRVVREGARTGSMTA
jgi:hypothetical protein